MHNHFYLAAAEPGVLEAGKQWTSSGQRGPQDKGLEINYSGLKGGNFVVLN